ncbi:MAG TPA: SPW repeat protein [Gemmatimonadaceae bacterium]|nr:SPW repeat protein [Gemmatimonadaceae bacterium]
MRTADTDTSQVRVASGLNFLAGIWIIISAWVYGAIYTSGSAWNSIIVGIVIAVFSAIRFFSPRSAVGLSWINALLGIWMIISPWVFGYAGTNTARMWNSVIFGIIVLILGVWSAAATRDTRVAV